MFSLYLCLSSKIFKRLGNSYISAVDASKNKDINKSHRQPLIYFLTITYRLCRKEQTFHLSLAIHGVVAIVYRLQKL